MRATTYRYDYRGVWSPPLPDRDEKADLVLCFCARHFDQNTQPFADISNTFPNAIVTGCSTAGEISGMEVYDDSISLVAVEFDASTVMEASTEISPAVSGRAGSQLRTELESHGDLKGIFLLSDGLRVNGSELVRGATEGFDPGVVLTGGLAADGDRFQSTWVIVDGKPASGHAVAVGLYGDRLRIGHGSKGGWDIFGPERMVTKSDQNVLYELDHRPALDLYKEYLGELADGLPATGLLFPLSLRESAGSEKSLVRTILSVDEKTKSLTFAGDVPQGHISQLMQANFDRLVDGAEEAAGSALRRMGSQAQLSIAISCVGRRLVLGERTEEELEATTFVLPDGIPQIGFYSYGEISPYSEGTCDLHNQTMTLTTLAEV